MQKISSVLRAHCIKNKHVVVRGVQGWVLGCVLAHSQWLLAPELCRALGSWSALA